MMLLECCWSCKLGHKTRLFLLVVGLLLYLVIGAFVFQALEERNESDQITELRSVRAEFAAKIGVEDEELEEFIQKIVTASQAGVLATNNVTFDSSWTFGQAFFFVGTLVTTVGYGHTVPLSYEGKVFAILYSLLGVPLAFIMFSAVVSRLMRPLAALLQLLKDKVFTPATRDLHIRLTHLLLVILALLIFFYFIPAGIFTAIEVDWNYTDSLYYCFISLTTIGLGDYIPGEDLNHPTYRAIYKIAVTFYLFLGIIFMLTTVAVLCNIQELNLKRYFVLGEDNSEGGIEQEQLTPKDVEPKVKYTEENVPSASNDNSAMKPDS